MSAIGDYVHYTAFGYNAYGIQRSEGFKTNQRSVNVLAINANKAKLAETAVSLGLNRLENDDMTEIENSITKLMKPGNTAQGQAGIDLAWQMICDELKIDFYDGVANQINQGSGNVKARIGKMNQGRHYLSTFLDRIQKMNSLISEIKSVSKVDKIKYQLSQIESNLLSASNITEDMLATFKSGNASAREFLKQLKLKDSLMTSEPLVESINKVANLLKGLSSYVKGQMFEKLIAVAQVELQKLSQKTIKDALSKVTGGEKTGVYIKDINFSEDINLKSILSGDYSYDQNLSSHVSTSPSSDKVDVQFNYHGKNLKVSAKNVNLYGYPAVSLVTRASFLALIQSMDSDFVNHYLNIMVQHYALPPKDGSPISSIGNQAGLRQSAKEAMKINLLAAALMGHKLDVDTADVFIINNNAKGGQVKVFNIGTLIKKGIDNLDLIQIKMSPQEDYTGVNKWQTTVGERLTNILARIHGIKVSVKFKNEAFDMI